MVFFFKNSSIQMEWTILVDQTEILFSAFCSNSIFFTDIFCIVNDLTFFFLIPGLQSYFILGAMKKKA